MDTPFPVDPVLTGIALAYRNAEYIADLALPRVDPPLPRQVFNYKVWKKEEAFTVPNTAVGRRGAPSEVEFTASEVEGKTSDYGLDDPIPQSDIDQGMSQGLDPLAYATQGLSELVALDREVRVAAIYSNTGNFGTSTDLSGGGLHQWSDFVDGNPLADILNALDGPLIRPNTLVFGRAVFTTLRQHPKIVKAVLGNSGDSGAATKQQLADLFEVNQVLVGSSMKNTAKKGQAATLNRVWGKICAGVYLNPLNAAGPGGANVPSWGATFQYGTRIAGAKPDEKIGLRGGQRVRVGESLKEVVTAADLGFLFTAAIA